MPRVRFLLALLSLPLLVGCDGCRRAGETPVDPPPTPLEDFSSRPPLAFPSNGTPASGIKPGHWITASQALRSNKIDSRGDLISRATAVSSASRDGSTQSTASNHSSMRPVVLPKGQMRRFDFRVLTPTPLSGDQPRGFLDSRFVSSGRTVFEGNIQQPFGVLAGEEFFFVILTERPERFAKFQVSDWARPYRDEGSFKDSRANYRIILPPTEDLLPLAETMLDWTSTAVVLWDDLPPDALTPQQQTAIADWVRFGGQLIVNGAAGSEAISQTALADLLPIQPRGNIELDSDAAAELLQHWGVASDRSTEKQIALLRSQPGRVAVDGSLSQGAAAVKNTGDLVITRPFGRGRVVLSRFDLTTDWLANWQSYDSFVNAVLLARPRRALQESAEANYGSLIQQRYPDLDTTSADPAFNSHFRIAARDALFPLEDTSTAGSSSLASRYDPLTSFDSVSGISGWSDNSDVLQLSRDVLRSESGIEIPKSSLVIRYLGFYLLMLVPVNYLIFRLMGKLEYAWLAVPVIAVIGAIWVARAARLDIGFARSQTEVAFLELQGGYPRGHLTRVVAIYNSLSSMYDIEFKYAEASAAPLNDGGMNSQEQGPLFKLGFSEGPILSGLPVISNQVRLIHAEQMIDFGGAIELDESEQLVNRTSLELSDAVVVARSEDGTTQIAFVGPCSSGSSHPLRFRPFDEVRLPNDLPMQAGRMMRRLAAPASMANGSVRLVARYDGAVEGMTITPDTNQTSAQTIVMAHLRHPDWPDPRVDVNLVGDLRRVLTDADAQSGSLDPESKDAEN